MLINLLENIFNNNSFKKKEIKYNGYSCLFYNNELASDFFILLDKDDISYENLVKIQEEVIGNLDQFIRKKLELNEAYEKNTTFILCLKETADSRIDNIINQIEEDKYLFKKNILMYSEIEVKELESLLDNQFSKLQVNKIIHTKQLFDTLKVTTKGGYALLLRLIIKLPFLTYQRQTIDLENLSKKIEKEARTENLEGLYGSIVNSSFDVSKINSFKDLVNVSLAKEIKDAKI